MVSFWFTARAVNGKAEGHHNFQRFIVGRVWRERLSVRRRRLRWSRAAMVFAPPFVRYVVARVHDDDVHGTEFFVLGRHRAQFVGDFVALARHQLPVNVWNVNKNRVAMTFEWHNKSVTLFTTERLDAPMNGRSSTCTLGLRISSRSASWNWTWNKKVIASWWARNRSSSWRRSFLRHLLRSTHHDRWCQWNGSICVTDHFANEKTICKLHAFE